MWTYSNNLSIHVLCSEANRKLPYRRKHCRRMENLSHTPVSDSWRTAHNHCGCSRLKSCLGHVASTEVYCRSFAAWTACCSRAAKEKAWGWEFEARLFVADCYRKVSLCTALQQTQHRTFTDTYSIPTLRRLRLCLWLVVLFLSMIIKKLWMNLCDILESKSLGR